MEPWLKKTIESNICLLEAGEKILTGQEIKDIHTHTLNNDIEFDIMMCNAYGVEWRWEISSSIARMLAKRWNFGKLYGSKRTDLQEMLDASIDIDAAEKALTNFKFNLNRWKNNL